MLLPSNIDGSGCYRVLLPGRELRLKLGWEALMAPHRVRANGRHRLVEFHEVDRFLLDEQFDVMVWAQRGDKWAGGLTQRLREQGKRVLVDSDDLWMGLPKWNPGSLKNPDDVAWMTNQLRAADGLSVATPALAEVYAPYQGNVRVIRNYLDWRMWEDVTPVYELERRRVRVGWMGDARWRAGDIDVLAPWLGQWLEKHPEVEFVAAGDTTGLVHDHLGVPARQRVSTAPVEFFNFDLADITATFDIGLVPLKVDDPKSALLNECKSHLKGLEYAACGIPCIATPTESYRWWRGQNETDAETCILAETAEEWVAALDVMISEDWRRNWRRMGHAARVVAEQNTLQEHIGEWEDWIAGDRRSSDPEPPRTRTSSAAGVG